MINLDSQDLKSGLIVSDVELSDLLPVFCCVNHNCKIELDKRIYKSRNLNNTLIVKQLLSNCLGVYIESM